MSFLRFVRPAALAAAALAVAISVSAQDRLSSLPGADQFRKMSGQIPGSVTLGQVTVTWRDGGKSFDYSKDGKTYRYDVGAKKAEETKGAAGGEAPLGRGGFGGRGGRGGGQGGQGGGGRGPERGRQFDSAESPDKKFRAYYKDRNLWFADSAAGDDVPLTTDGSEAKRIKYGTASWVYGEELAQTTAMWWSPDSKYLAYYRFDESKVTDYYLQLSQTAIQSKMDVEPYPKAGTPNPVVDLFVYDVAAKKSTKVDVRDGKPFENATVGYYVYQVAWAPGGKELLFNRTNRRQNVLEFCAADPATGKCRVIVREEWPTGWVDNHPPIRWLKDNKRFLWTSERTGFKNFYLYDVSGELIATVTNHPFEVAQIVRIDEDKNLLYYLARDGDNHMKMQLHRCTLDGKDDKRLTDPAFNHGVNLAPDGKHFIDVAQTHDIPPITRLVDENGAVVEELAKSDTSKFDSIGLKKVELITFKAGDGKTDLHGLLHKPSNFDPTKKYPLLVSVYAGPNTNAARETFTMPSAMAEYGFLVASFDSRSASGRGKKFIDDIYEKLGVTEIDDQAAGVKSLWDRPYVDKNRVGIYGTSYGGYASALCILRHPDVFQAACASSPVTDYRHYDTIYTERYMWIPQENKKGYDAGSAMTYANKLKGRLMIYYGTADNNVHPNNSMQLIKALQTAGKNFEVQVGPDRGHSAINQSRMMEFFIENLNPKKPAAETK